jgi:hypothetical protein
MADIPLADQMMLRFRHLEHMTALALGAVIARAPLDQRDLLLSFLQHSPGVMQGDGPRGSAEAQARIDYYNDVHREFASQVTEAVWNMSDTGHPGRTG